MLYCLSESVIFANSLSLASFFGIPDPISFKKVSAYRYEIVSANPSLFFERLEKIPNLLKSKATPSISSLDFD